MTTDGTAVRIGVTIPVAVNFDGALAAINTLRTAKHILGFHIVNNRSHDRSVAASWNLGCEVLFGQGSEAVVIANDDILCSPVTLDGLVKCWQETGAGLVSGADLSETVTPEEISDYAPRLPHTLGDWPNFSLFLLPRSTWDSVGRFDENFVGAYYEDDDYHARGVLLELSFICTSAAPFYHFGGVTQRSHRGVSQERFRANRDYFLAKWGDHVTSVDLQEMRRRYYRTPFNDPTLTVRDWPHR